MAPPPSDAKRAAAPIAAPKAAASPEYAVPERVRALLGPSWLIEGEDPKLYEELLGRVGAAVQPKDIIDWLLLKDAVALTWEIQRSRRTRESLVRLGRRKAMEHILKVLLSHDNAEDPSDGEETEESKLASKWCDGQKTATKTVESLFAKVGLSMADVAAQAMSDDAGEFDRIDAQTQRCEERRDRILQQIERRWLGWPQAALRASEEVIDAEFKSSPPALKRINGSSASKGSR